MHKFLKSVGFSMCRREKDIKAVLRTLARDPASVRYYQLDYDTTICEIKCEVAPGIGVAIYGEMDERDDMEIEYYYPYLESSEVSSSEYCTLQRHIDRETFAGMLEEKPEPYKGKGIRYEGEYIRRKLGKAAKSD